MENTLPLEERSINQIYFENQESVTYTIPVYQRNYAWEEEEITALIKDVYDSLNKKPAAPYYIGTLVTYKRGEAEYEVIDGQQRLTTIYIILQAMGIKGFSNKLTYGARETSASTIKKLQDFPNLGDEVDRGIQNGYKYAAKALAEIVEEKDREAFKEYFLYNVRIIHYQVPKDVNLNHYFEVMNSRGEQLEKHEIVKSILSQKLDKSQLVTFCRMWEACSEMNVYVQQVFPIPEVFGEHLNQFLIHSFEDITIQDDSEGRTTIMSLLQQPAGKTEDVSEKERMDKFQPIIDFPNFLLIVLKITRITEPDFDPSHSSLDDKELLNEFTEAIEKTDDPVNFSRKFALNLLKAKFLLDNYIVHHSLGNKEFSNDNPWKLQCFTQENKKRYPKNLAADQDVQDELVHLLSMFEVAFTAKQRKNYLFYCLLYLFEHTATDIEYLTFLRNLADKYFYDVYLNPECLNERNQPRPNAFDNALLNQGVIKTHVNTNTDARSSFEHIYQQGRDDIPLYVFNYTDYRIWRKYAETLRGNKSKKESRERKDFFNELGCSDFELEPFNNFYFSRTRKSLEHYYPQAKAGDNKALSSEDINCFGNFAMIGAEANSSGSNWDPKTKLDHYTDGKSDPVSVASLKFKIMIQICKDNHKAMLNDELIRSYGMEWNAEDIKMHQDKMLDIITPFPTPPRDF